MNLSHPLTIRRMKMIKDALHDGPLNAHDLAGKIFMSLTWTQKYLIGMHEAKMIRVCRWEPRKKGKGMPIAYWSASIGRDEPKPAAKTSQQKGEAMRARIKADPEYSEYWHRRRQALRRKPKQNELVSAFYGMG